MSELEHLQEELQRTEAEEKENRQVELQRSTVRSRRGRRQKQEEQGESEPVQEDAKVSLLPPKKLLMLVEEIIWPLNIFMSTEEGETCPPSTGRHSWVTSA